MNPPYQQSRGPMRAADGPQQVAYDADHGEIIPGHLQEAYYQYLDNKAMQNLGEDFNEFFAAPSQVLEPVRGAGQYRPDEGDLVRHNYVQTQYNDAPTGIAAPIDDPQNSSGPLEADVLGELLADTSHNVQSNLENPPPEPWVQPASFGSAQATFDSSTTEVDPQYTGPGNVQEPSRWGGVLFSWASATQQRFPTPVEISGLAAATGVTEANIIQWFRQFFGLSALPSNNAVIANQSAHAQYEIRTVDSATLGRINLYVLRSSRKQCIRGNNVDGKYRCIHDQFCGLSFSRKSDWKRHLKIYSPQEFWECPDEDCKDRIYGRDEWLASHLRTTHGYDQKDKYPSIQKASECLVHCSPPPFSAICGFCGGKFTDFEDFADHVAAKFAQGYNVADWWAFFSPDLASRTITASSTTSTPSITNPSTGSTTSPTPRSRRGRPRSRRGGRYGGSYMMRRGSSLASITDSVSTFTNESPAAAAAAAAATDEATGRVYHPYASFSTPETVFGDTPSLTAFSFSASDLGPPPTFHQGRGRGRTTSGSAVNPWPLGWPPPLMQQQAQQQAALFSAHVQAQAQQHAQAHLHAQGQALGGDSSMERFMHQDQALDRYHRIAFTEQQRMAQAQEAAVAAAVAEFEQAVVMDLDADAMALDLDGERRF